MANRLQIHQGEHRTRLKKSVQEVVEAGSIDWVEWSDTEGFIEFDACGQRPVSCEISAIDLRGVSE